MARLPGLPIVRAGEILVTQIPVKEVLAVVGEQTIELRILSAQVQELHQERLSLLRRMHDKAPDALNEEERELIGVTTDGSPSPPESQD